MKVNSLHKTSVSKLTPLLSLLAARHLSIEEEELIRSRDLFSRCDEQDFHHFLGARDNGRSRRRNPFPARARDCVCVCVPVIREDPANWSVL